MESKSWFSFDFEFQVIIYPCAILFSKQTLYFSSSLLQKGLLIAQAQAQVQAMAFTCQGTSLTWLVDMWLQG